jgi:hypothetical protein
MLRHWRVRSSLLLVLLIALLAPLPGCNRNDEAPPPIVVVTPEPVRGVIAETSVSGIQSGFWVAVPFQTPDRGVLDITVDWRWDDSWMYTYFGDTECDYVAVVGDTCPYLIRSETKEPKPRVLETGILDAAVYYIFLYNRPRDPLTGEGSDRNETASIVVGLTVGVGSSAERVPVRLGTPFVVSPPQF